MCARDRSASATPIALDTPKDLLTEIKMLRAAIQRIYQMTRKAEDVDSMTKAINSLGLALSRLASLLKSQQMMSGGESELVRELNRVIDEVIEEQRNRPDESTGKEYHA